MVEAAAVIWVVVEATMAAEAIWVVVEATMAADTDTGLGATGALGTPGGVLLIMLV